MGASIVARRRMMLRQLPKIQGCGRPDDQSTGEKEQSYTFGTRESDVARSKFL